MKRIHWLLFTIILLGWGFAEAVEVEGVIGSDTIWSPENNPYQVIDDIEVPEGITLTIEPGVRVEFMDNYNLVVYGALLSEGTESDSIYYTSGQLEPEIDDSGIISLRGESASGSIISYSVIEYAVYGLRCELGSTPRITHCLLRNNDIAIYSSISQPEFSNNYIINNIRGIKCNNCNPVISNNVIVNNLDYGVKCNNNSSPLISKNSLINNLSGITCSNNSNPLVLNNIIYTNETGIDLDETSIPSAVDYNLFWLNTVNISEDVLPGFGELTEVNTNGDGCDIYYNLFLDPEFIDPENGDFHLVEYSPAIDAGNPGHAYTDPDGSIADLGALYYQQGPLIPLADFIASPLQGGAPLAVQFTNLSLYGAETYLWEFGDGETSMASDPLHIYENSGNYSVTLSAYGENGSDTFVKEDYITVIPGEESLMGSLSGVLSNDNIYSVFDDISVDMGDTLIIEPGVTIRFMGYYSFTVSGTLLAEGTETDSIYFTSGQDIPDLEDWEHIELSGSSSSNSRLSYCRIDYNLHGILCSNGNNSEANNCTICNCDC